MRIVVILTEGKDLYDMYFIKTLCLRKYNDKLDKAVTIWNTPLGYILEI